MLKKPDIIFIDLDGTTLDQKKSKNNLISQYNKTIISQLQKKNIKVIISTGRGMLEKTFNINKELNLEKNIIFWNGSKVMLNDEIIFDKTLDKSIFKEIINLAQKYKILSIINSDFKNQTYSNNFWHKFSFLFLKHNLNKYDQINFNLAVYKIIFWHFSKRKLNNFYKLLKQYFDIKITAVFSGKNNSIIEVTAEKCTKGEAEILICQKLNINPQNCWHVGDTLNDLTTKNKIGKLIAMKNSNKTLKQNADFISKYNYKKGGLGKTLKELID
ncbi:HAD family hydrolase [Mycoplasma sp. 744]|uniref:HAD family hydrolase n=1 Tax=Mycoplasma sp. 744 TaxID=3108531 RepID=UPI002B1D59A7|nr:HAD family hydrolase [Mycoplasma sp. 744]MEA4115654.1 HAD family hydrolase [Mycoplasma sp. 744]